MFAKLSLKTSINTFINIVFCLFLSKKAKIWFKDVVLIPFSNWTLVEDVNQRSKEAHWTQWYYYPSFL